MLHEDPLVMSQGFEEFDAAAIRLKPGVNLIEAGAGTGKTYAIGMLVLRSLVELDVALDHILIVTFTKAATEELRGRIRSRLVEARDLLLAVDPETTVADPTLLSWRQRLPDQQKAVKAIQQALLDYDQAAIFTIHGFCQRMLAEQALESGQLFDAELLADLDSLVQEVGDDFWRAEIYALPPFLTRLITTQYAEPEQLLASVRMSLHRAMPVAPDDLDHDDIKVQLSRLAAEFRSWWGINGRQLADLFAEAVHQGHFKKDGPEELQQTLVQMGQFCADVSAALPSDLTWLERQALPDKLNGKKIRKEKKDTYFDSWPLPDEIVPELVKLIDAFRLSIRVQFAFYLREQLVVRMARQGCMGFDDLIHQLAAALTGGNGSLLCAQLGNRYQVALIDEFQDTDLDQYTIFSRLFGHETHWLYLIGDPKQAIYGFRGADIHSYFLAQKSAGRKLTLTRNYRSHPALVAEVNRLFAATANPFGYADDMLQYRSVTAAKTAAVREITLHGQILSGMHYCALPPDEESNDGRWTSGKAAEWLLHFTVRKIVELLGGETRLTTEEGERRLRAGDIAILVRSNRQATRCRDLLADANVHAVLASRQSVFTTDECRELIQFLKAVENPADIATVKGTMTLPWFGKNGRELVTIWQDEKSLGEWVGRFHDYRRLWFERGFMTMFALFLSAEDVLPALSKTRSGERKITNIQHLAELVQEQEAENGLGAYQVMQWLARMSAQQQKGEANELLLESDSDAVKIVTMHLAKGLQYHVVFCPYLWYWLDVGSDSGQVVALDGNAPVIDLGSPQFGERLAAAAVEQRAENVRLLYVALTRAMSCCYVMWADIKSHKPVGDARLSSLGELLFPGCADAGDSLHVIVSGLANRERSVFFQEIPTIDPELPVLATGNVPELVAPPVLLASHYTDWQMSSFSAMVGLSEYEYDSGSPVSSEALSGDRGPRIDVQNLPAGATFGNLMHDLLEHLSFSRISSDKERALSEITAVCNRYGIDSPSEEIYRLLSSVVDTPLASPAVAREIPVGFALNSLDDRCCLKEMPYYLRFDSLLTSEISDLLHSDPAVAPLSAKNMQGYLNGFIDLVFEYGGQYFLCDYKTNFLGNYVDDYRPEALVGAMQAHNYGLQYWLYTVVLNRYLTARLPAYSYTSDFGGVIYLFLRGMSPASPGSGVYFTKPEYSVLQALDGLLGGGGGT